MTQEDDDLQKLQAELVQMTEIAKRTMADFQNFKRHTEEQHNELKVYANKDFLEALFPALDNLKRAFEAEPEEFKDHEWTKGLKNIERNLIETLGRLGLEVIDTVGVPLDPHQHEVLLQGAGEPGTVIQIFERGYRFNGKTLRPAKVMVGGAPEAAKE